jgi:hypothetical protein
MILGSARIRWNRFRTWQVDNGLSLPRITEVEALALPRCWRSWRWRVPEHSTHSQVILRRPRIAYWLPDMFYRWTYHPAQIALIMTSGNL